jgi:hypothetical protein
MPPSAPMTGSLQHCTHRVPSSPTSRNVVASGVPVDGHALHGGEQALDVVGMDLGPGRLGGESLVGSEAEDRPGGVVPVLHACRQVGHPRSDTCCLDRQGQLSLGAAQIVDQCLEGRDVLHDTDDPVDSAVGPCDRVAGDAYPSAGQVARVRSVRSKLRPNRWLPGRPRSTSRHRRGGRA